MRLYGSLFAYGGTGYILLELAWRGRTHPVMFAAGGTCFALIHRVCYRRLARWPLPAKCIVGGTIITGVELLTGLLINRRLHWNVWDYRRLPWNYRGQICVPYSLLWCLLTAMTLPVCRLFKAPPLPQLAHQRLANTPLSPFRTTDKR